MERKRHLLWFVLAMVGLVCGPGGRTMAAQEQERLRDIARSIPQLPRVAPAMDTKDLLSGGNAKIDGTLRQLIDRRVSKGLDAEDTAKGLNLPLNGNLIAVDLRANDEEDVEALQRKVEDAGGKITAVMGNTVMARIPVKAINDVGAAKSLYYMGPQERLHPMGISGAAEPVVDEGVARTKADLLHSKGLTGKGVRVGVLDFGFIHYGELQASGAVPTPAAEKPFNHQGVMEVDTEHGTACAEIIHAMAPDAKLYLAAVNGETDQIILAARWLVAQGVNIISFSGGGHDGPENGSSPLDKLVEEVVGKGVMWVNAAGNEGASHWGGTSDQVASDGWLRMGPNGENVVLARVVGNGGVRATVTWDDWGENPSTPSATQDIDAYLFVFDPQTKALRKIGESLNPQNGRGEPVERVGADVPAGTIVALALRSVHINRKFPVHAFFDGTGEVFPAVKLGSIGIPATSRAALSVGAVNIANNSLEPFSSQGPTDDGRVKPEISAPDGNLSAAYKGQQFFGTSAACPHAAGFAALLKQRNPGANPGQLRTQMTKFVHGMGTSPQPNNQFGFGYIDGEKVAEDLAGGGGDSGTGDGGLPVPGKGDVELPASWGGHISAASLDQVVASSPAGDLDIKVVVGQAVYHIGDGMKIGYRSAERCYYVLLHRSSEGQYTVLSDEGAELDSGHKYVLPTADETIRVTGPAGSEQVILICSKKPINLNHWREEGAGDSHFTVAIAGYAIQ